MLNILRFILLMSVVVWVGMLVFFTFFITPSVFKVLPRELAADLVSDIFPKYWTVGYVAGILSITSLLGISFIEKGFPAIRIALLGLMTAVTFYSGIVVGGKAKAKLSEMKAASDPVRKEEIRSEFKKIHFKSAALNMVVIVTGVGVVFFMSRSMRL